MQNLKGKWCVRRGRASGFTLVELLVVIAIISLLIAMLMPGLGQARRSAMTIQCATNFRTMGQAFAIYATDNKDSLFHLWWGTTPYYTLVHGFDNSWYPINQPTTVTDPTSAKYNDIRWILSGSPTTAQTTGFAYPKALPSSLLPGYKSWICPFVNALPIDSTTSYPGDSGLNQSYVNNWNNPMGRVFASSTVLFFTNDGKQGSATQVEKFFHTGGPLSGLAVPMGSNFKGSFPLNIYNASPDLPMAQDAYDTERQSVAGAWVINHIANGNAVAGQYSPCDGHNETMNENDGIGANILFYDTSVRFVPAASLVRVDAGILAASNQYMKSVLPPRH